MPLTFVEQLESTARRIERRRWATVGCWAFAAFVAATLGLITLDHGLGVHSLPGRVLLTGLLLVALVVIWRKGRGASRGRMTPLDVALELERRYPEHRSLLASGLQFSQQEGDDPTAGSLDLRRAVVLRASLAAEAIDVDAVVPLPPLRRAALVALLAALALADLAAVPQVLATGVVRLLNPLSDVEWPRRHDLAFVDPPSLLPVGADFETTLRDRRGKLPSSIEVEYRTRRQGGWHYQTQTYGADTTSNTVAVRWPNVQESFEFRARGGDHESMPWRRVETAPAPQIELLTVTVEPPAYTSLPTEPATEPLRVFASSTLTLRGKSTLPIKSAELHAGGHSDIPLRVGSDRRSFESTAAWQPAKTAEWSFALTTPHGMTALAERRLTIEVVPDKPPTVEILQPTEDLVVLPEAVIDLSVEARDDLAVKSIAVVVVADQSTSDAPLSAARGLAREPIELFRQSAPAPGAKKSSHTLELSQLSASAGSTWEVHALATDFSGQESKSPRRLRLSVVSREEFTRRVDALRSRLVASLERARAAVQQSRHSANDWLASKKRPSADEASVALSGWRTAAASLAAGPESALRLAGTIATEYDRNRWPADDARSQIQRIAESLGGLAESNLRTVETELATIAREVQRPGAAAEALNAAEAQTLTGVVSQQGEIGDALEVMLRELSQSSEIQQHQRELAELERDQSALVSETEALAREALQSNPDNAADERNRRREQTLTNQRELAARLANALGRMRQSAAALSVASPTDAARLDAVVASAEESRIQAEVQTAADHLAAERLAQAAASQRRTTAQLQQLLDRLAERDLVQTRQQLAAERRRRQTLRSKQQIERLDAVLSQLVAAQQAVVEMALELDALPDPAGVAEIAQRQAAVRQQSRAQADQIEQFPVFARLLRTAADTMKQAENRLTGGTAADAAPLATRAHEQLQLLADAVRQQRQQQSQPPPPNRPQASKPPGNPNEQKNDPDQVQALQLAVAQLGLLRIMQADLQERTKEYESNHASGDVEDAALAEQSTSLADEQHELAELAESLVRAAAPPADADSQ